MRISNDFLLRKVYDQYILFPVGQAIIEQRKIMKLNETGYVIAQKMLEEISYEELFNECIQEYRIENEEIEEFTNCLHVFLEQMKEKGIVTENVDKVHYVII